MADGKPGAPKGHPRWGGRVAGTPNKATLARAQVIAQALIAEQLTPEQVAELMPLEVLLRVMRSAYRLGDYAAAQAVAIAAAPYCHAKLGPAESSATINVGINTDDGNVHFYMPSNGRDQPEREEADAQVVTIEGQAEAAGATEAEAA